MSETNLTSESADDATTSAGEDKQAVDNGNQVKDMDRLLEISERSDNSMINMCENGKSPGRNCDEKHSIEINTLCLNQDYDNKLRLDELPSEILLHILSYLDPAFITSNLSKVCSKFKDLAKDQTVWRVRLHKTYPNRKHPPIPVDDYDWRRACVSYERERRRWSNVQEKMNFYQIKSCVYTAVDAVHLMQEGRLLATGSRDKYLNIIDLSKLDPSQPNPDASCCAWTKQNAHGGWIWSIKSVGGSLATGSWDRWVKFWDIETKTETCKSRINSAVLCMHYEENFLALGSFDKYVYHFDPREGREIFKNRYHTKPVLCMAGEDGYIVTGGEDSKICVFDRRACKVVKTIVVEDSYPMSISHQGSELWVGDKAGRLSLYDTRYGAFNLVQTLDVGHSCKMTGLIRTDGALFTSSMDHTVRVLEPCLPPHTITTLTPHNSEIAEISYQNGILACACSGQCIGVYIPKQHSWS